MVKRAKINDQSREDFEREIENDDETKKEEQVDGNEKTN